MKKKQYSAVFFILLMFSVPILNTAADDNAALEAFRRNFTRGSLSTKVRVLQDSLDYENTDMGPLYIQSLDFIMNNYWMLRSDTIGRELMFFTIRLLSAEKVSESAEELWEFFNSVEDAELRVALMNAVGNTAGDKSEIIHGINNWLRNYNVRFKAGNPVDEKLVAETVAALGKLGDPTSFPIVFATGTIGYSEAVNTSASEALGKIDGYFTDHIIHVIQASAPKEKIAALKAAFGQDNLGREDKASIARVGLDIGLYSESRGEEEETALRELRYEAVRELTELDWAGEADNLIKHFDYTLFEFEQGLCPKTNLIEAIEALGSAGTHDAAVRLTLYLEVLNSYTENGQTVDEQIILEVITNLGELGDSTAFDYLLYTGYLNYSSAVQRAAREALENLKKI
jgi:hypothetical protein